MAIENLTGKPNKELTDTQRRNKRRAKELNIRDVNYDAIPDRDQVDMSALGEDLKFVADIVRAEPSLEQIFLYHVNIGSFDREAGATGIANFKNDIVDSDWWKTNNQYARQAFADRLTDQKTFEARVENVRNTIKTRNRQNGGRPLSEDELSRLANQAIVDGWDTAERSYKLDEALGEFIGGEVDLQGRRVMRGSVASTAQTLRQLAVANGLKLSDNYFFDAAKSVTMNLTDEDYWMNDIREQAAMYTPMYAEKIRAGMNVRDLASSYIYTMAQELEVDPSGISLDDPYIRGALTGVDEQGNPQGMSLWEFQRQLRNDPRWMNTNKAQNKVSSIASDVMQMFGLVG